MTQPAQTTEDCGGLGAIRGGEFARGFYASLQLRVSYPPQGVSL
jgi:hypothetical protein